MMIDMSGPDIQAVHEVKALILESVNPLKNYKNRLPSRGSQGARAHSIAHATRAIPITRKYHAMENISPERKFIKNKLTLQSVRQKILSS